MTQAPREGIKAALRAAMDKTEKGNSYYGWLDLMKALRQATGLRGSEFLRLLEIIYTQMRAQAGDDNLDTMFEDDEEP